MTIFLALCAGLGLSAACGLRVFLPLFVAAVAVRAGGLAVGSQFDWLGSNAAIVVFGTATAVEIVGFLIPWVDHVLDLLAAPLAAVAGSVLMCSQLLTLSVTSVDGSTVEPLLNPAVAWSLGIIVGAATASGVEAASIAGRLSSSVLTIGWLNPIYGMIETALAFIVTLGAIWIPIIVGGIVLLMLPVVLFAIWRIFAWRSKQRRAHEEKLRHARERIAYSISHHNERIAGAPHDGPGPSTPA